jgi:steroid delta-isomerase-like uncharacterized protein
MSLETTQQTMQDYLSALLGGGDFAQFFADDVVWTTTETGQQVHGRDAVRDFIVSFHTQAFDARPEIRSLTVTEGAATLEADFVGTHTGDFAGVAPTGTKLRVPYCVVYDIRDNRITALRGYLPIAAIVAKLSAAAKAT